MVSFWSWLQRAWAWIKKRWAPIFGAIVVVGGGVAGAYWLRRRALGRVQDELAVARAQKEIARLRGVRDEVARRVGEKDEVIEEIDSQLADNRRQIVEAHENGKGLNDEEVLRAFEALGY